jgi:hypothetical protein
MAEGCRCRRRRGASRPAAGQLHYATSWVRCRTTRRLHLLGALPHRALLPWRALASLECVSSSKREEEEAQRKKKDK